MTGQQDPPPIPEAAFEATVRAYGGAVERGPAGDLWISGPKGEYGPVFPIHGHISVWQAEYAMRDTGLGSGAPAPTRAGHA